MSKLAAHDLGWVDKALAGIMLALKQDWGVESGVCIYLEARGRKSVKKPFKFPTLDSLKIPFFL